MQSSWKGQLLNLCWTSESLICQSPQNDFRDTELHPGLHILNGDSILTIYFRWLHYDFIFIYRVVFHCLIFLFVRPSLVSFRPFSFVFSGLTLLLLLYWRVLFLLAFFRFNSVSCFCFLGCFLFGFLLFLFVLFLRNSIFFCGF